MNALVVDDLPDMRLLVATNLRRRFGFHITEAEGYHDAIDRLNEGTKFNLIVSDYMMPGGSGLDLLDYIQFDPAIDSHFILFTSAADQVAEVDKEKAIVIDKCHMSELLDTIQFLGVDHEP